MLTLADKSHRMMTMTTSKTKQVIKQMVKQKLDALPDDCSMEDVLDALKPLGELNLPAPEDNLLADYEAKSLSEVLRKWIIQ
jgi:hypothetical protein